MYSSESVQFKSLSCVWLFATPWTAVRQASLSITSSQSLLKLKSIKSVMPPTISSSVVPSPTFNLSQHQGLFQWISSSYQVDKVLEFHLQHQSFQWIFKLISWGWTGWISLQSKGLSRVFYNTTVQKHQLFSAQFSSVAQSSTTLCDPMNCSRAGHPVHHQLPEFTQTHIHRVGDAIQPSHLLSSPSPPTPNHSQHQSLFQWVNSSHEVAKVLEFQPEHHSFQWTPRTDLL